MKVITNATGLMLVIPVHEITDGNSKCTDVKLTPVISWVLEKPHKNFPVRITPVAVGTDNDDEGMKIVYNEMTEDWYVCNADQQGRGKTDLIELFNIHNFLNEDEEVKIL